MLRRLSALGVFCALLLQGWGGALASALCPHAGAATKRQEEAHSCCPAGKPDARAQESAPSASHCPMSQGRRAADEERPHGRAHNPSHEPAHAAAREHARAAVDEEDEPARQDAARGLRALTARRAPHPCSHCVGRPDLPPAPNFSRETNGARRGGSFAEPRLAAARVEPPRVSFVRFVTPTQHAPPAGGARRHALLGVLLI